MSFRRSAPLFSGTELPPAEFILASFSPPELMQTVWHDATSPFRIARSTPPQRRFIDFARLRCSIAAFCDK